MLTVAHRVCTQCVLGLTVVLTAGCTSFPSIPFLGAEKPDVVPGVVPPSSRIAELRALRKAAGSASAEQREQVSARLAEQIAQETDASLRAETVRTLAVYPTDQGKRILRQALEDADRQVRMAACEAWAETGDPEAIRLLGKVLRDDADIDVRLTAAKALGATGHPTAAAALAPALSDTDPAMQYRATISLRQVTGENFHTIAAWQRYLEQAHTPDARPSSVAERPRPTF